MTETDKMYVVVRADLPAGAQLAQSCHGLRAFMAEHPEVDKEWYETSNNLVCLQVPDEAAIFDLADQAAGYAFAIFREPDEGNTATAIVLEPAASRLLSSLPLALKRAA